MRCPSCSFEDTKVLESRLSQEGKSVRRRRSCPDCMYRFTTYERIEDIPIQVEKKNDAYEPFSREKLIRAIQSACIKRPVALADIEAAVARIEKELVDSGERIIPSRIVGDLAMVQLRRLDHVAYVRFASIYKDFKDPDAFRAEIEGLKV